MVNVDVFMFAIPVPPFPSHIWVDSQSHPYIYCSDSESFDMPDHIAAHLKMSSEIKLPQRRDSTSSSDEETITSEDDEGDDSVSIVTDCINNISSMQFWTGIPRNTLSEPII